MTAAEVLPRSKFTPKTAWTPEQAKLMAARSAEARKRKREAHTSPPDPTSGNQRTEATSAPALSGSVWQDELAIVERQISRACEVLNSRDSHWCEVCERGGLEPHHRAQLLKALDALLDRKRILLGVPLPGSRRPAQERSHRPGPSLLALPSQPVVLPPPDREEQAG